VLVVEIRGWSKLWALKKHLRVPLSEIRAVRRDPQAAKGWWKGWRMPGTHIPGIVVDVADPESAVRRIEEARARAA
jgi:hypothetical protein